LSNLERSDDLRRDEISIGLRGSSGFFTMDKNGKSLANSARGIGILSKPLSSEEKSYAINHIEQMIIREEKKLEELTREE